MKKIVKWESSTRPCPQCGEYHLMACGYYWYNKIPMAPQHAIWGLYVALGDSGESDIYKVGSIPTCDNQ